MRGKFIIFEGPDGAGTTTHSARLAEHLTREGKDVWLTREPTAGPIGQGIREILDVGGVNGAALQLLFCADRADHVEEIERALEAGKTVICDRYVPSTLAYGSALGLDTMWLRQANAPFPQPDHTFLLLPPLAVCLERLGSRTKSDALENAALAERVYAAYELLAEGDPTITVIDTSKTKEEVEEEIMTVVRRL